MITAVIACADTECRRTLAAAISALMPVADTPPKQTEWVLVAEEALFADTHQALPPCRTFILGNTHISKNDDVEHIALPFRLQTLLLRLQVMLARPVPLLAGSSLELDARTRLLTDTQSLEVVELTEKETRLLDVLVLAAGNTVDKDILLKDVWVFQSDLNTHTLETHISRLRAKIQQLSSSVAIRLTEGGYQLIRL